MSDYSNLSNRDYWIKRVANENWKIYNNAEKRNKALIRFYNRAIKAIEKEVLVISNKVEKGKFTVSDLHKKNRLLSIMNGIIKEIKNLGGDIDEHLKEQLENVIEEGYIKTRQAIDINFGMHNKDLSKMLLDNNWSGEMFSERIWNNMSSLEKTLNKILKEGLIKGLSADNITKLIRKKLNSNLKNTLRLVRTETMHFLNESSLQAYKDAEVEEVEIIVAKDEKTCEACNSRSNKTYLINNVPILPIHPNCRCTYIPVIDIPKANPKDDAKKKKNNDKQRWNDFDIKEKKFKSKKEMKNYLKNNFNIDFRDSRVVPIDFNILEEMCNFLNKFDNFFEKGYEKLGINIPAIKSKKGISSIAYYRYYTKIPRADSIVLNAEHFSDYYKTIDKEEKMANEKWSVKGKNAIGSFVHEFGHHVENSLYWDRVNNHAYFKSREEFGKEFFRELIKSYNKETGKNLSFSDMKEEISRYGATTAAEAFAEAFSCYFNNNDEDIRDFIKYFGDNVVNLIKEIGGEKK